MAKEELKRLFEDEIRSKVIQMKKEGVHNPTLFLGMVDRDGWFRATINAVSKKEETSGFAKLLDKRRTDLSLESSVVKEEFKDLFDEKEINLCKMRLGIR